MNTEWMDLHGETPIEPERSCFSCAEMLSDGECLNSDCKECERTVCAECNKLTYLDELKQDPYPLPNWMVCPKCYRESQSRMGAEIP